MLGVGALLFMANVVITLRRPRHAPPNPWQAHSLEWATSSPPPTFNFTARYPIPPIHSYAPLLDLREREEQQAEAVAQ